jgi:hypothetical protein
MQNLPLKNRLIGIIFWVLSADFRKPSAGYQTTAVPLSVPANARAAIGFNKLPVVLP